MVVILSEPPFPVIHGSPGFFLTLQNFRTSDYYPAALFTVGGAAVGYYHRQPRSFRRTNLILFSVSALAM